MPSLSPLVQLWKQCQPARYCRLPAIHLFFKYVIREQPGVLYIHVGDQLPFD